MGHYVEALLIRKQHPEYSESQVALAYNGVLSGGYYQVFKQVHQKMQDNGFKGTLWDMQKSISGYAKQDFSEAGAEAIADVFSNGKNASEASRLFVQILQEHLK